MQAATRCESRWRKGEAEARGGGGKARLLFGPVFFGGVLVFSVVFCLAMGAVGGAGQGGAVEIWGRGEGGRRRGEMEARGGGGQGRRRRGFLLLLAVLAFLEGCWFLLLVFLFGCRGWGRCWSIWRILVLLLSFVCCGAVEDVSCFSWFIRDIFLG